MAPPPVTLKDVEVKVTVFTTIEKPADLGEYIVDCVEMGSNSDLYSDPSITAVFYGKGTDCGANIQFAITAEKQSPTEGNKLAVTNQMALGVLWLKSYSSQVEVLANLPANRTTREQAAENITHSFLSYQQLETVPKGDPESPVFTVESLGSGNFKVTIVNGATYTPSRTNLIAIEMPPATVPPTADPVVALAGNQMRVQLGCAAEVVTNSLSGKGRSTIINVLNTSSKFIIYGFSQNGNKQVSKISAGIIVKS